MRVAFKRLVYLLCISPLFLQACELFTIGSKKEQQLEINQFSPAGTVYLFKSELDSNNIPAATRLLINSNGKHYLAIEKYEFYDEIARVGRILANKPVTSVKLDSLSETNYRVNVIFDYFKKMSFYTYKLNNFWFITSFNDSEFKVFQ